MGVGREGEGGKETGHTRQACRRCVMPAAAIPSHFSVGGKTVFCLRHVACAAHAAMPASRSASKSMPAHQTAMPEPGSLEGYS